MANDVFNNNSFSWVNGISIHDVNRKKGQKTKPQISCVVFKHISKNPAYSLSHLLKTHSICKNAFAVININELDVS